MYILAIDVSTPYGSVALCNGRDIVMELQFGVGINHSEKLLKIIDTMLNLASWTKDKIEAIAVSTGPGSFTGLRVGIATAKGLALGLQVPVVGVSSLKVLAWSGILSDSLIVPVIDARRGEIYASAYQRVKSKQQFVLKELLKEAAYKPCDLTHNILQFNKPIVFVGNGFEPYQDVLLEKLKGKIELLDGDRRFPHASNLAAIALHRMLAGDYDNLDSLSPNYIRRSDAEIGFVQTYPDKAIKR